MSIADTLIEMGREAGIQTGVHTGIHKGESNFLLQLLENKYGVVSFAYRKRIYAANSQQLLQWMKQALVAKSLEEVFEKG